MTRNERADRNAPRPIPASLPGQGDSPTTSKFGGAYVREVVPGSPADHAGLQPGDVIVAVNGGPISNWQEVTGLVSQSKPGLPMKIDFMRAGQTMSVEIYLAAHSAVFT